jgi:hypothetical protein
MVPSGREPGVDDSDPRESVHVVAFRWYLRYFLGQRDLDVQVLGAHLDPRQRPNMDTSVRRGCLSLRKERDLMTVLVSVC